MLTPVPQGRWLSPGSEAVAELEESPRPPLGSEVWAEMVDWWGAHLNVSSREWPGEGLARHDLIPFEGLAYSAHPHRANGHAGALNLRAPCLAKHHTPWTTRWCQVVSQSLPSDLEDPLCALLGHMDTSGAGSPGRVGRRRFLC